jgi:hypothetical protein
MNQHPRSAMKWLDGETRDDLVGFYNYMIDQKDF